MRNKTEVGEPGNKEALTQDINHLRGHFSHQDEYNVNTPSSRVSQIQQKGIVQCFSHKVSVCVSRKG